MSPGFPHHFQDAVLRNSLKSKLLLIRGYHPLQRSIPGNFRCTIWIIRMVLQHHISITLLQQIRFALFCFRSLLLTESQLISFPAGTKTFQFPAFLLLSECLAKSHSEILGSKTACISPRLIAACHVLLQLSSQAIHLIA